MAILASTWQQRFSRVVVGVASIVQNSGGWGKQLAFGNRERFGEVASLCVTVEFSYGLVTVFA